MQFMHHPGYMVCGSAARAIRPAFVPLFPEGYDAAADGHDAVAGLMDSLPQLQHAAAAVAIS